jgi:hypothetical protein
VQPAKAARWPGASIGLQRDDFSSNRHPALSLCLSMSFFAKPVPTFAGHAVGSRSKLAARMRSASSASMPIEALHER